MDYLTYRCGDMINGEGLRVAIWLSRCSHGCKGCFNSCSWNGGGSPFDKKMVDKLFKDLSKDYISGVTWSGGDPLHKRNYQEVLEISKDIKKRFDNKTIWLYTGYTYSELLADEKRKDILKVIDVLIDGRYEKDLPPLQWRGSSNQKVLWLDGNGNITKEE